MELSPELKIVTQNFHQTSDEDSASLKNGSDPVSPSSIQHLPNYFIIIILICYNLVLLCGFVGNSLVLYVIYSIPRMRTVTNYLLANLALADFFIALVCIPFTYVSMILSYWPFGTFLCQVVSPFNAICILVSAFTLIALAVEKYVAIIHPLVPRMRKSRVGWVIGVIWIIACVTASPIAWVSEVREEVIGNETYPRCDEFGWAAPQQELVYSLSLMMIQYFIPLGILAFTYTRISIVVWKIQNDNDSQSHGSTEGVHLHKRLRNNRETTDRRNLKAVLLTLAVVVGYTLAWLPLNVTYIILRHHSQIANLAEFRYIYIACHWLAMSHCFYNPMIYAWINSSFKSAFKDVLQKVTFICFTPAAAATGVKNISSFGKFNSTLTNNKNRSLSTTSSGSMWKSFYKKLSISSTQSLTKKTVADVKNRPLEMMRNNQKFIVISHNPNPPML